MVHLAPQRGPQHLDTLTKLAYNQSRLGESNPRPTHYQGVLVRCSRVQGPRFLRIRRVRLAVIVGC